MDWSLPYRDNSLLYTENVQMSSKQEFSLGYRIKISEKTVTHDNAFFKSISSSDSNKTNTFLSKVTMWFLAQSGQT